MIDIKQELQDYSPVDLNTLTNDGSEVSIKIKNSVILYNKALGSIRTGSEDIAIIELKKAIALNPGFHEAMNLLGICYNYIKEYSKAVEIFRKVVAAENNSVKAMRYLSILELNNPNDVKPKPKRKSGTVKSAVEKEAKDKADGKPFKLNLNFKPSALFDAIRNYDRYGIVKYLIRFIAGAVLVGAIAALFWFGFRHGDINISDNAGDIKESPNDTAGLYKPKFDKLNEEFINLQSNMKTVSAELDYYKNAAKLFAVEKFIKEKNYEAAADMLVLLKTVSFSKGAEQDIFNDLYKTAMPKAAQAVYNEGIGLFYLNKFQEALDRLIKVQTYGSDWPYMSRVLYFIGKCYVGLNDSGNAITAYQKVVDAFPGSQYAQWSKSKIKKLTEIP